MAEATRRLPYPVGRSRWPAGLDRGLSFFRRKPLGGVGAALVLLAVLVAVFSPVLVPYNPDQVQIGRQFIPPGGEFLLGTDQIGRDVFSRILVGARVSVYVGIVSVVLGTTTGALLGVLSAYIGGTFDALVQRLIDGMLALPTLVLALVIAATLGPSTNNATLAIAIALFPQAVRVLRSAGLAVKENQYIEAAGAVGCSPARILWLHVLPQCLAPYLIVASADIGRAVIVEASVSFVGAGPPPPTATWGSMLSGGARLYAERAPWLVIWPGLAIALAVYGFNLVGDAVRDVLDPRLRGTR